MLRDAIKRFLRHRIWGLSLKFILPFGGWLFLYRPYFTGQATIFGENYLHYSMLKFFLDSLRTGVYPLWNPYVLWGFVNHTDIVAYGPFNPIWGVVLALNAVGLHFYAAYLLTTITYFFIGMIGFYLLAFEIFKDKTTAYAAFLMLLFSSVSMPMFGNLIMLLIFIPGVWFFYFVVRFSRDGEAHSFGGVVFSLMLIISTYLPFYFLTVFMAFILLAVVLWPRYDLRTMKLFFEYAHWDTAFVVISLVVLGLVAYPSIQTYQYSRDHQIVAPDRQSIGESTDVFSKGVVLPQYYSAGGMTARMSLEDLYSNLDQIHYGNDGFFYIPMFCYLLILLGAFHRIKKRLLMFAGLSVFIFLMTISSTTPVHRFLYNHIFFFQLFRNLQYLVPYLLAVVILLSAEHLRLLWKKEDGLWDKPKLAGLFVLVVHVAVAVFLLFQPRIIITSYVTLGASALFFFLLLVNPDSRRHIWAVILLVACILIQPIEVFWHYNKRAIRMESAINRSGLKQGRAVPRFVATRPSSVKPAPGEEAWDYVQWHRLTMTDSPGFLAPGYGFPAYWVFYISSKIDPPAYRNYVQHKLLLYDRAKLFKGEELEEVTKILKKNFLELENLVWIAAESQDPVVLSDLDQFLKTGLDSVKARAGTVTADSDRFRLINFNANILDFEINLNRDKLLVYNDAYHDDWRAWVDSKEVPVFRANLAFKGIVVPTGRHRVRFEFRPAGGTILPWGLLLLFCVWIAILLVTARRPMRVDS